MGTVWLIKRDLDGAIESYQRGLQIRPDSYWAWANMGHAYGLKGEHGEAKRCYQKALESLPLMPAEMPADMDGQYVLIWIGPQRTHRPSRSEPER